jgi:hypothetical protein
MSYLHYVMFAVGMIAWVVYLGSILRLVAYLRRAHPDVWVALGRPAIPNLAEYSNNPWPFLESAARTMRFIFSDRYKELQDRELTYLLWLVRMSLAAGIIFFAAQIVSSSR